LKPCRSAGPVAYRSGVVAIRHVVLVGLSLAGKSTAGRALAERLGLPFVDADDEIVAATGEPVAVLFERHGEDWFRDVEADVVARLLATPERHVIALGGGAPLRPATRAVLAGHDVVWLRASVDTLLSRLTDGGASRPLVAGDPAARLAGLDEARRAVYGEVATLVVDVDGAEPAEVAGEIADALVGTGR
jgi:shikimate kinase